MNFAGASQSAFVKENHKLSRERTTVITSIYLIKKVVSSSSLGIYIQGEREESYDHTTWKSDSPVGREGILPFGAAAEISGAVAH